MNAVHRVVFGTHPAPLVTHSVRKAAQAVSEVSVFAAWEHNLTMQGVVATETDDGYQHGDPEAVIPEQNACKPKYVPHPPLVHPVFPFHEHEDK